MYTKGDWKSRQHGLTYQIYVETPEKPKAKEYQVAEGIYNKANADLISSAPYMYKALKSIERHQTGTKGHWCPECWDILEITLSKAEGGKK